MKNVLMIAHAFPPFFSVGYSIRVAKFIKYLPIYGWRPVVLTVNDDREYESMRKVGSEMLLSDFHPEVAIYRTNAGEVSLKYLENEKKFEQINWFTRSIIKVVGGARRWILRTLSIPDRYLPWFPFAARKGCKLVVSEKIDVIYATMPPYTSALVGAAIKYLTGKPLVLDFRDDWVGTPAYDSLPKARQFVENLMERWVVRLADQVILVTENSRNAFLSRYSYQPREKFNFIPNGCDLEEFEAEVADSNDNTVFKIVYAGSLVASKSWERSPAPFFHSIQKLIIQHPNLNNKIKVLFAGEVPEPYQNLIKELGLSETVQCLGNLLHNEVIRLSKSADLLLAIATSGFSTVIPGKIYEYWAVGGPPILLLSLPGAATDLLEKYKLGITVTPMDLDGIQEAILDAYHKKIAGTPLRISKSGIEAFDRRRLTLVLAQKFDTLEAK